SPIATPGFGSTSTATPAPCPAAGQPFPVEIIPSTTTNLVNGIVSTYGSKSTGFSTTIGRRLTDIFKVSAGINVQQVSANAQLPSGFFFPNPQNVLQQSTCTGTGSRIIGNSWPLNNALGISPPPL